MSQHTGAPLDGAYESRRRHREAMEQEEKLRRERTDREELSQNKASLDKTTLCDQPKSALESGRASQVLEENPTPEEEEVRKELVKSAVYFVLSLYLTVAGALLVFTGLSYALPGLGRLLRLFFSGAVVAVPIILVHAWFKKMNERLQRILFVVLFVVAVANIGVLARLRAEYSTVVAQQERNEITAAQAQEKRDKLDFLVGIVHFLMALSFESLAGLAANRATQLYNEHWPNWKKYRNRRFWESECTRLEKLKIDLEHRVQFLEDELKNYGSGSNGKK